jgi:glycerol uptake facilitator-like aquaporin
MFGDFYLILSNLTLALRAMTGTLVNQARRLVPRFYLAITSCSSSSLPKLHKLSKFIQRCVKSHCAITA